MVLQYSNTPILHCCLIKSLLEMQPVSGLPQNHPHRSSKTPKNHVAGCISSKLLIKQQWSIGVLEYCKTIEMEAQFFKILYHHSITPLLQYPGTPLLQHSNTPLLHEIFRPTG
jgi:hypothetical protein